MQGMTMPDNEKIRDCGGQDERRTTPNIPCKLFDDVVTAEICRLRKGELNGKTGFSCFGCMRELG